MVIETHQLKKIYRMGDTEVQALKGIDLQINHGEFVALTGYSGSGKSTLMHLLGCLDKPTSGQYTLDGISTAQASSDSLASIRNKKIGFIFQKFYLLPDLTTVDNVALPMLYAGYKKKEAATRAEELLCQVGLEKRLDHFPYQLSGGQQQRVAIARSLANKPSIILADEPTGNLDAATGDIIMDMLQKINSDQETTIIIVTHEPLIAAKTKRIIELIDGKIIADTMNTKNNAPRANTP